MASAPDPGSAEQTQSASLPAGVPAVTTAIAIGWQMAELYQEATILHHSMDRDPTDLPGMSALGSRQLIHLRFDQVSAGLSRLSSTVASSGMTVDDLKKRSDEAAQQFGPLDSSSSNEPPTAQPISSQQIRRNILDLHVQILDTLTATDASVGKAYGLGRALADLTMRPAKSTKSAFEQDFGGRVDVIKGWLHDLKTALPDHAAVAIRESLSVWQQWIDTSASNPLWDSSPSWSDPIHPLSTRSVVTETLSAQGSRWRSVLTAEKQAIDMISANDYVAAGEALAQRVGSIVRRFLRQFWLQIAAGAIVLAGIVTVLLLVPSGSGGSIGALGVIAAATGITWKGVESSLGAAVRKVEPGLWGAELDLVVTVGITYLPGEACAQLTVPKDKAQVPYVALGTKPSPSAVSTQKSRLGRSSGSPNSTRSTRHR